MNPAGATLPWYGLRVRSRQEQLAVAALRGKGYAPFLPSYTVRRRWSDRVRETALPLFPGYLFCRLDPFHRLPVLTASGVVGIVGLGKVPVSIEEREIESVRAVLDAGLPAQPWPFIHHGDAVQVTSGPLRGVRGVVQDAGDRRRLVVSVTLLQRSISVQLDAAWVAAQEPNQEGNRKPCTLYS